MKRIFVLWLVVAVVGCATRKEPLSDYDLAELAEPLECKGVVECGRLWRKAQAWVVQNAGYKIQSATDAYLQTYNAQSYSSNWAMQLTRMPIGPDTERINLDPSCGPTPLCKEDSSLIIARFRRQMRQAN